MKKDVKRPEKGKRKVTVRELVEGELDVIVGGSLRAPELKHGDKKKYR